MTVFRMLGKTFGAFFRVSWLLALYAILGAVVSVVGGMMSVNAAQAILGVNTDAAMGFAFLPVMMAHAAFLIVAGRMTAEVGRPKFLPRIGLREGLGFIGLTVLFAATGFGSAALPEPAPFLVPIVLAAVLAWTPIVPAIAVGSVHWSWSSFATAILVSLPFLAVAEVLGLIPQAAGVFGEGFSMLEGGAIVWPLLGLHMWLATVTAALVSTVVYTAAPPDTAAAFS